MLSRDFGNGGQTEGNNVVIPLFIQVLLNLVSDHHEDVGTLIHQLTQTKVPDTLLCEVG